MSDGESRQIISFDGFELDAARRKLMREGKTLPLNAKAFDLLVYLAENAGRVVSKDEILDAVWANQFVEEANLKVQMSALRKALGERKDEHRFLVTIPGKGYKFVADLNNCDQQLVIESHRFSRLVEQEDEKEEKITVLPDISLSHRRLFSFPQILVVSGIIVGSALGLSGFLFLSRNQTNGANVPAALAEKQTNIKRLTNKGNVNLAVLSPDGRFFAYSLRERGNYRSSLWLGQTNGNSDVQLRPADDLIYYPRSFSLDGNWLYYMASEPRAFNNGTLYKMPVLGGVPQKLVSGISVYAVLSPDEKQIAFVRGNRENRTESLIIANLDGSREREITARPAAEQAINSNSLSWSADGSLVAFGAESGKGDAQEIFTANTADGTVTQLTALDWTGLVRTEWRRDGGGLLAVARDKRAIVDRQLWQIDYPSGRAQRITRDLQHYGSSLSLSADSNALLAVQGNTESHIWVAPAENLAAARQLTFGSSGIAGWYGIDWMPDGKIIYAARSDQSLAIWAMDADGGRAVQITSTGFMDEQPTATADGKFIVFKSNRSGAADIWRVQKDGTDLRQLTFSGGNAFPHVTPDGKTVVYMHNTEGTNSIWRISIEGGEATSINDRKSSNPRVSPDGNFIACGYISDGETKLAIISISGGEPVKLFDVPPTYNFNGSIRWTRDGRFINYRDWANGIWQQSVEGSAPVRLEGLPAEKLYQYEWSPDGKQLAFTRGHDLRDAVLITDFK